MSDNRVYHIGDRDFTLSPLTPRVEEHILTAAKEILGAMPDEVKEQLESKDISQATPMELLDSLGAFAVCNQTRLLACIVCPVGTAERDKNVLEIAEYLLDNLRFWQKVKVVRDFLLTEDIKYVAVSAKEIYQKIKNALDAPSPSKTG